MSLNKDFWIKSSDQYYESVKHDINVNPMVVAQINKLRDRLLYESDPVRYDYLKEKSSLHRQHKPVYLSSAI
jgi:hypothetical protein